jgi:RimJ/RimL family protein N-acetyltransferase
MAGVPALRFSLHASAFRCSLNPWDSEIFGFPVATIERIGTASRSRSSRFPASLSAWLTTHRIRIASCRLPCAFLRESISLEEGGFRFVEVVLHPCMDNLSQRRIAAGGLQVHEAHGRMLEAISEMAASAFGHERYHTDPRLEPALANARYAQWVVNSVDAARTQVLGVCDNAELVAFFVCKDGTAGRVEWLLTAVAPPKQGQGFGLRAWQTMLAWHQSRGGSEVVTTIAAGNVRVLNLYAKLGFRFLPPEMTFHWVAH